MDLLTRLSYLFGSEETVYYRRLLILLREKILTLQYKDYEARVICSGSLGEGVTYPHSDDDLMIVDENQSMQVYDNYEEAIQHTFYMIPSDHSPGFCVLQCTNTTTFRVLSSKLFRDRGVQLTACIPHGRCVSEKHGPYEWDLACCLSSPHWPMIASEWITRRRRYGWPSRELMETIVRGGCFVVPIGNPDSPICDIEWRVSFSLAERTLIHRFNHVQFIVYNLLKLILKRVIGNRVPNALCSYFLKTTLFYVIENTPSELWEPDNMKECYGKCLALLYHFIDTRNCPNYFVPGNNMMRRKINANSKGSLLSIVADFMRCGIEGALLLCGESFALYSGLSPAHIESKLDIELIAGYVWRMQIDEMERYINELPVNDVKMIKRKVLSPILLVFRRLLTENNSKFLCLTCRQVFTLTGSRCVNTILGGSEGNRLRYERHKFGEALLRIGCNTDISSGRLHLANYLFMTGRIQQCLVIIMSVLSKYAPYVMSAEFKNTSEEIYREVMCNKAYSLEHKTRRGWALNVILTTLPIALTPFPLNILRIVGKDGINLHPLVYSYFLQGLCYHQTCDYNAMKTSVTLLEATVKDLPSHRFEDIFFGRFLTGNMKMLQQDYHSSCRCLTSAYLWKDDLEKIYREHNLDCTKHAETCVILLACVINHALQLTYP